MPRQRLFLCFVLVWAIGLAGFVGGGVRRFLQTQTAAYWLTSENLWFHPQAQQLYFDLFEHIAGHIVQAGQPVYAVTVNSGPQQFADRDALARLIDTWLYPRVVPQKCTVEPGQVVADACALPASRAVIIGWGFTALPGYVCIPYERNYVVCH